MVIGLAGCSAESKEARYLRKGKKEFEKKDYLAAILHFKNAVSAKPLNAEPYYQLGLSYLAVGDFSAAAGNFRRATELNHRHIEAQVKLAGLMANSRSEEMHKEAEKRMLDALTVSPENLDVLDTLAAAEIRLGKTESAEAHLLRALQNSPAHMPAAVALARIRAARKDVTGAEEVLKQVSQQNQKSPDARVYLGGFYLSQGKAAEAEQQYREAIAIDAKHGPALLALANLLKREGRAGEAEQAYRTLSKLPDKTYRPLHALYLLQTGKTDEGIAELAKLETADPSDRTVRTELVNAYLKLNRVADAAKVLTAALEKNAVDVDARLQRARIYLLSEKNSEAQNDLNEVLHYRSNSAEAHYLLSKISQSRGDQTTQKQELGEVLRLQPDYLAARLELVELLTKSGGAKSAIEILNQTPPEQKKHGPVVLQRNWVLLALGQRAEARKNIDDILAVRPLPEAWLQDAALKALEKNYPGAKASVDKALDGNPEDIRALSLMVQMYASQKQLSTAVQRLREHAIRHPGIPEVQQLLGQVLSANGDSAGARQSYNSALAAKTGYLPAELALAELDTAEGKRDDARKRLATIISRHPDNVAARMLLARVDVVDGNMPAAMEQYRKVVDSDPKNALALNNVAYILSDSKPDEALKYAQLAKQHAPENATVDDTLGWIYYQKGLYRLAVTYLQNAVDREDSARRKYHLAMAYLKAGDPQRGRQTLDAALKMDPNLSEAQVARRLFGQSQN